MRLLAKKSVKIGALACTLLAAASCKGEPRFQTTGVEVEGVVTLDGKPLQTGMVQVVPASGMVTADSATGTITEDGHYSVSNVPVGNVKFMVRTSHLKGMAAAGKMSPPRPGFSGAPQLGVKFVDVPKKYEDADASKLTATVTQGKNTVNLDLKSK